ncbi:MAG: murein transglycosylase domain-containing protein [Desulfobacula sp.]|nr:murein transglycosylase domain-containing protein [Desulfobacula sp.]
MAIHIKNITLSPLLIVLFICLFVLTGVATADANADRKMSGSFEQVGQNSYKGAADIKEEWNAFANQSHQEWYEFKNSIERKWDTLVYSTKKEWITYDKTKDTRSSVDFKKGEIKVETLVSAGLKDKFETVKTRLYEQLKKILKKEIRKDDSVLKDQVKSGEGKILTDKNLDIIFAKEIIPKIQKEPAAIKSKDGMTRQKFTVSIKMVPDHLDVRAKKYTNEVKKFSRRFSLNPGLVMAMIHTESYFNPLAVSDKGAIGLMQIVPKWAGKEAYEYLYGEQFNLEPDYLFSPGINLELGTAYLHLLQTRYFHI